ncbi:hypothetical protein GQ53DRAFT_30951 [Thozetella sp. PMI_491]|nr:hypothetical protein GQ53DRAFT_30951 [Thozetella sp. PMI_491]
MNASHHHRIISHSGPSSHQTTPRASVPCTQYEEPSPPYTTASSTYTTTSDHFEVSPAKRQRLSGPAGAEATSNAQTPASAPIASSKSRSNSIATTLSPTDARRPSIDALVDGKPPTPAAAANPKSRRVRTGCLTCRERHLKCDEGAPICLNCRKSNRECKRGMRLNFIDTQCKEPPFIPPTSEWSVSIQDESRLIASEYQGGLRRYAPFDQKQITPPREMEIDAAFQKHKRDDKAEPGAGLPGMPRQSPRQSPAEQGSYDTAQIRAPMSRRSSEVFNRAPPPPPVPGHGPAYALSSIHDKFNLKEEPGPRSYIPQKTAPSITSSLLPNLSSAAPFRPNIPRPEQTRVNPEGTMTPPNEKTGSEREYLATEEEVYFMQVFVSEVAVWMDTLDSEKSFTRVVPYLALKSPMLLNAFLACGMKHLTLVSRYEDEKALAYYDTATMQLMRSLQNPDRNMAECATVAVILNVYEIMSEKAGQRMSHIAGARALIRECGWDARSKGIAAACFWLNIGMEVLSCLAFNWQTAWDPDHWGLEFDFTEWANDNTAGSPDGMRESSFDMFAAGKEEDWVHRIFYIMAKIANFKANVPRFQEASVRDEEARKQSRHSDWMRLKNMCDSWNKKCPSPMRPFGYCPPGKQTKSLFPNIWLINRPAIIGRLFYHTAMCLLAQINPLVPSSIRENREAQIHHAHQVCGIVAHTTDRGAASVAIRSLAIASAVLTDRAEQSEVLSILDRINLETGWRLEKVLIDLKKTWGWSTPSMTLMPVGATPGSGAGTPSGAGHPSQAGPRQFLPQLQQQPPSIASSMSTPSLAAPMPTRALVNPMLAQADFSLPNHPYKNFYEPPNRTNVYRAHGSWSS